jgi:hypothetical protein
VADINDRLERLNRREELARRAHERPLAEPPAEGLSAEFAEVLDAVSRAVLRHPGLSVLVTTAEDGRTGRAVVRVSERDGMAEAAVVIPPAPAGRHAQPTAPVSLAPAVGGSYHRSTTDDSRPYARRRAARPLRAVADEEAAPGLPDEPGESDEPTGADGPASADEIERMPAAGHSGLVALPADTSEVVARLAKLLRDDPTLAAGWARRR